MGEYRVRITADMTVPKKKNADFAKDAIISMIMGSGFEEKDFIIEIDKTGLVENAISPEEKNKTDSKKHSLSKEKKIIVKRKFTKGKNQKVRKK